MIDCHCHLLFGIDDGAQNMQESLQMARQAVDDGISTVVCTPHAHSGNLKEQLDKRDAAIAVLQDEFKREDIPLTLQPGCEYYADGHAVDSAFSTPGCRLGTQEDAPILVELPPDVELPLIADLYFQAQTRGLQMILAHPTRYNGFLENVDLLRKCMDRGLILQFNSISLTQGFLFFRPIPKAILSLIRHNPMQILLGSDAHDPEYRKLNLTCAKKAIAAKLGDNTWELITKENPRRMILG